MVKKCTRFDLTVHILFGKFSLSLLVDALDFLTFQLYIFSQLVMPGSWLSDLCQERYEVREKKASKKVRFVLFPL